MRHQNGATFHGAIGLHSPKDLPAVDELHRIPAEKPPGPVTAKFGLVTNLLEQLDLQNQQSENQKAEQGKPLN